MNYYSNNPLVHRSRIAGATSSAWRQSFDCSHIKPLIICRGPIRKEAIDVMREMGIEHIGILLSEKDSIVYTHALAPELRSISSQQAIHRVPDYSGASKEERHARIKQIIRIAKENHYDSIFAGYGFMAEDEFMVASMEEAGLNFIGPCSRTVRDAGLKDEAKRTAQRVGVSVTPGIDNATTLTLLKKYPSKAALHSCVKKNKLKVASKLLEQDDLPALAEAVLDASYQAGIDLYTIEELASCIESNVADMFLQYPNNRLRLKAIGGGGGKGQRILAAPADYTGSAAEKAKKAASRAPEMVREILNEVKATGVGDNKNVLIELNIETTRHQEIQVVGNGHWCISMGGRDCSLQMHEQKLLEVSVVEEDLKQALQEAEMHNNAAEVKVFKRDIRILDAMEKEAARFGAAVGLDSVSTFECIVDRDQHFFMEMNTRIQVEHRVSELCYGLCFSNPEDAKDSFEVESLVELMVLLACHGKRLPKPERYLRNYSALEARLNATNDALRPHAGGIIHSWSAPVEGEVRDDQGISLKNPDTNVFIKYRLAGAYDSNVALLLTVGENRLAVYKHMAKVLRKTQIEGRDLQTNVDFHYGLINWFVGNNIHARPTTRFIVPYLSLVGLLKEQIKSIDVDELYAKFVQRETQVLKDVEERQLYVDVFARKQSLLLRPLQVLFNRPHSLSGWLSIFKSYVNIDAKKITFRANPIFLLREIYVYLNMDFKADTPAAKMIWHHDQTVLTDALAFYKELDDLLNPSDFADLQTQLAAEKPKRIAMKKWQDILAAHSAYQLGMDIFLLPFIMAKSVQFYDLRVNKDLTIHIPDALLSEQLHERMAKVLVPPPLASSNEIVALSGGMFYPREAPNMPPFVEKGSHFERGDPLYIVEVMKMFNKVYAPFSGTIDEVLVETDGAIIAKGQTLFNITPDEKVEHLSIEEESLLREQAIEKMLEKI